MNIHDGQSAIRFRIFLYPHPNPTKEINSVGDDKVSCQRWWPKCNTLPLGWDEGCLLARVHPGGEKAQFAILL
ncbi:hypothetical protein Pint_08157 [Pistacia integerrima]|uniref:Uncharacterized protein n=1 Tax=Pistacia integerrima TaxID=434235 RepID=A0ACC0XUU3_9ROSI|nr:hypothetical protein Pint_08157 [Pistacia integerrima]